MIVFIKDYKIEVPEQISSIESSKWVNSHVEGTIEKFVTAHRDMSPMKLFKDKFSENLPSLDNSYEFTVTSSHGGRLHSSRINSDLISRV